MGRAQGLEGDGEEEGEKEEGEPSSLSLGTRPGVPWGNKGAFGPGPLGNKGAWGLTLGATTCQEVDLGLGPVGNKGAWVPE